jgi:hypothetical protein
MLAYHLSSGCPQLPQRIAPLATECLRKSRRETCDYLGIYRTNLPFQALKDVVGVVGPQLQLPDGRQLMPVDTDPAPIVLRSSGWQFGTFEANRDGFTSTFHSKSG